MGVRMAIRLVRNLSKTLQNTELHDQQNHDPSCSQSVVFHVINTAPNMGPLRGDLRNAVRKFFQLKIQMQPKWAKLYRLTVRMFDADASSRAEGEFSDIWQLGLTASMTFRTSLVKIRFGSDRRMSRKIVKAETLMGTQLKRRKSPR
jgi:hypothetical protein